MEGVLNLIKSIIDVPIELFKGGFIILPIIVIFGLILMLILKHKH